MGVRLAPSTVWAILRCLDIDHAASIGSDVVEVPASASGDDAGLRLLHRRHYAPAPALSAVLRRDRLASRVCDRRHG